MKRRQVFAYVGVGAVAALAGAALKWKMVAPQAASSQAMDVLFAQSLNALDGTPQAFSQWRGQRLVVNFWATWCPPCVDEMPELDELQQEFSGKAQFVGIGIDSAANMLEFVKKVPVRYPLLVAGNVGSELARELGNTTGGLPFTVIIDEEGKLIHQHSGRIKAETLRSVLKAPLA